MRVLITGGAGFIGSHLVERLLAAGHRVAVVDNLDEFYPPPFKRANLAALHRSSAFEFHELDICQREGLRPVWMKLEPDCVVHLAARVGVRPSLADPRLYERVNFHGTLEVLRLCREFRPQKFVFASSSSVYGNALPIPFSEDASVCVPLSPYGMTKLAGEWLCREFAAETGVPVVCLRFFSVYGPRQRPDLVLHKFTRLMERDEEVPLLGNTSAARDYTYIDDIVAGTLRAIDYRATPFEIINLGNNHPVPLHDLLALLEARLGRRARRRQLPPSPADMRQTWADISKARQLLGYEPRTPLEEGIAEFLRWYREQARTLASD